MPKDCQTMMEKDQSDGAQLLSYKGLYLIKNIHTEGYMDTLQDFEILDGDICVVSFPKSGLSWMQYILALMMHPEDLDGDNKKHLIHVVPWIEVEMKKLFGSRSSPRLFASHLLPHLLPPGLRGRGKVIYITRNPKDVAVSLFHFQNLFKPLPSNENFDTFLEEFLNGKVFGGSWFDHIRDWHNQGEKYNLLFVTYEELKKDLRGSIIKIAAFLNKTLDEETVNMIFKKSKFSAMRDNPNAIPETLHPDLFETNKGSFMRKGKVGDWKSMFTLKQSEKFDKIYQEKMKGLSPESNWELGKL